MPELTEPVVAPPVDDVKTRQKAANALEAAAPPEQVVVAPEETVPGENLSAPEETAQVDGDGETTTETEEEEEPLDLSGEDQDRFSFSPADEDEDMLFGPTTRPDEPMSLAGRSSRPLPPQNIERYLPILIQAAREPDAPPELIQFLRMLDYHMSQGEELG